jgi:hypothetical protein
MDSILVVCYSYTGTTRRLAQLLCSHHGWPMGEVTDKHPRAGASGTLRCVLDSLLHRHPAVRYEGPDPGDFHTVVLLSPIWVYRVAGPMRSFVTSHREALRRVALVLTMGTGGASNAVAEIAHTLRHAPILVAAFTSRSVDDGSATARLIAFGDELLPPSTASQSTARPAAIGATT